MMTKDNTRAARNLTVGDIIALGTQDSPADFTVLGVSEYVVHHDNGPATKRVRVDIGDGAVYFDATERVVVLADPSPRYYPVEG